MTTETMQFCNMDERTNSEIIQDRANEIELKIGCNEMSAGQVYTQMMQLVNAKDFELTTTKEALRVAEGKLALETEDNREHIARRSDIYNVATELIDFELLTEFEDRIKPHRIKASNAEIEAKAINGLEDKYHKYYLATYDNPHKNVFEWINSGMPSE